MKKFFMKFLDIRVLSIIFAILIWYYVIGVQGPIITRTFKVPITPINLESGVFIVNNPENVNVTAEGSSKAVLGIKGSDFTALVNLAGKSEGEIYVPVDVKPPTSAIKVKMVSPEKVKIGLEKITTRKLPIVVKFKGKPADDFMPASPIITPDSVVLTGPLSKLEEIESAIVEVDLTGISSETTVVLPIQLIMKSDANISDVQVNPTSCVVKILESNPTISKTVPIVPQIKGRPFQGFGVKAISLTPGTITLEGNLDGLSNIKFISTAPIDITGITETKAFDATVVVPDGVKVAGSTDCTVTVEIAPVKKLEFTIPLTVNYDSVQFDANVSVKEIKVIVMGFEDVLNSISQDSVTAVIDVSKFGEGTYTVPIQINGLPQGTVISIIQPEAVQITLTKKDAG